MIAWKTGHKLNEAVMEAVAQGLRAAGEEVQVKDVSEYSGIPAPSISYGVLRGVGAIYRDCARAGVEWWNVDHGFFGRQEFGGYYRIGRNHLQPLFSRSVKGLDPSRVAACGAFIAPWRSNENGSVLLCPPTSAMAEFYGIDEHSWPDATVGRLPSGMRDRVIVRKKGEGGSLAGALNHAGLAVVFNSNVAIDALRCGVPAIAEEGIVRSWNGLTPEMAGEDLQSFDRRDLFLYASWCQFTLDEIRSGFAWRTCQEIQKGSHAASL